MPVQRIQQLAETMRRSVTIKPKHELLEGAGKASPIGSASEADVFNQVDEDSDSDISLSHVSESHTSVPATSSVLPGPSNPPTAAFLGFSSTADVNTITGVKQKVNGANTVTTPADLTSLLSPGLMSAGYPYSAPYSAPSSAPYSASYSAPYPVPYSVSCSVPYSASYTVPYSAPYSTPY